jgi:tetratricopeptide (TPR) repeat protein
MAGTVAALPDGTRRWPAMNAAPRPRLRLALARLWGKERRPAAPGDGEGNAMSILRIAGVLLLAGSAAACGEDERAIRDCQSPSHGDMKRLIQACTQMIADRPRSSLAYANRCQAYNQLDDPSTALPDCTKAIQLDPYNASAYNNRGWAYEIRKQYDLALKDYDKAIELDPKFAVAFANRGDVYRKKGDRDRAIVEYRQALALEPGNEVALSGLTALGAKP